MTTVLVVHREEGTVGWLGSHLEAAGFPFMIARNGASTLDLVRREPLALVLLGLMPPLPTDACGGG